MAVRLVVRHVDRPTAPAASWTYEFEQARVAIGRGAGADVRLPDLAVSEHHATLEHRGEAWTLRDEGSTNGTRVNGVELVAQRARALSDGDAIELGSFILGFESGAVTSGVTSPERTASLARRMLRDLLGADSPAALPPRIVVIEGPDVGLSLSLPEPPASVVLGRGEEAALALADPDTSRAHCELVRDEDGVSLHDLASKNGVLVNGKPARTRRLKDGDTIHIGATLVRFQDPAEQALRGLSGKPDTPVTRTKKVDLAPPETPAASASASPKPSVAAADPAPTPTSSMDALVYVLSALILTASVLGLLWLFSE